MQKLEEHARADPKDIAETILWVLVLPPNVEEELVLVGQLISGSKVCFPPKSKMQEILCLSDRGSVVDGSDFCRRSRESVSWQKRISVLALPQNTEVRFLAFGYKFVTLGERCIVCSANDVSRWATDFRGVSFLEKPGGYDVVGSSPATQCDRSACVIAGPPISGFEVCFFPKNLAFFPQELALPLNVWGRLSQMDHVYLDIRFVA